MLLRACLHLAQPRNMTKEGGDRVSPLKRYFVVPRYILPFYPIISEVPLRQEVVNNPLACQDAFRDDRMGTRTPTTIARAATVRRR